jgi:hypothetical protein
MGIHTNQSSGLFHSDVSRYTASVASGSKAIIPMAKLGTDMKLV